MSHPGDIHGSDGSLIGRKDMSDADFLAPLLELNEYSVMVDHAYEEEDSKFWVCSESEMTRRASELASDPYVMRVFVYNENTGVEQTFGGR